MYDVYLFVNVLISLLLELLRAVRTRYYTVSLFNQQTKPLLVILWGQTTKLTCINFLGPMLSGVFIAHGTDPAGLVRQEDHCVSEQWWHSWRPMWFQHCLTLGPDKLKHFESGFKISTLHLRDSMEGPMWLVDNSLLGNLRSNILAYDFRVDEITNGGSSILKYRLESYSTPLHPLVKRFIAIQGSPAF